MPDPRSIRLSLDDNVIVAVDQIPAGASAAGIAARERIMRGHKMATAPIAQNEPVLKFLDWCLKHGQDEAKALDYVPMPDPVVKQIEGFWQNTFKENGKPIWTAQK